ncbi:MAG: alanine--tRNA ligase [Armatimonadota bacterium]|nr:alanine--tRNA ligase [Armatimonadota bacterium]
MTASALTQPAGGLALAQRFLRFFEARGHTVVPGSSLVPAGDPTLLFTNAGMVQFKDVFLGRERRSYTRAATLQRCLRVSGKHNDLEAVGPSPRHHTLFFMLGNFSFGDYFKREAVAWAWEFVTGELAIPPERLVVTVLEGDEEAEAAWRALGVPDARILRMGEATNFWSMGDVGPCGPTSELHYDWGRAACTCGRPDCSVALDNGCGRWLEVWNLVFMQYDQAADGTRTPLPRPGVDTGMGLERIAAVVQQAPSNYDTDLFAPILDRIQHLLGHTAAQRAAAIVPYRVIADHTRAATFLIADGVLPGNEGRAYVLRMILRRAMRFGRRAGVEGPFLGQVAAAVMDTMREAFPDLERQRAFITAVLEAEEQRFSQTLAAGLERLAEVIAQTRERGAVEIAGADVFRLYDTYGFPLEMTRDVAAEAGLAVDEAGFRAALDAQRRRSRAGTEGVVTRIGMAAGAADALVQRGLAETAFVGYTRLRSTAQVLALVRDGVPVEEARAGDEVIVVLDRTPFYAEAGGQVGDTGTLVARGLRVTVTDTRRLAPGLIGHHGRIDDGRLRVGQRVRAAIDAPRRAAIMRSHTATHLLHRALQEVLGEHARQAGSLVAPDRLRFDFAHLQPLSAAQREAVERRVNAVVLEGRRVRAAVMPLEQAVRLGAMALFGEKYGERVRVVTVADYSRELCGGTHLRSTAEVGLFLITAEVGIAAGVRRIEALTGLAAYERARAAERLLAELGAQLRVAPAEVADRVRRLQQEVRTLQRQRGVPGGAAVEAAAPITVDVDGVRVATARIDGATHEALREAGDRLRTELGQGVLVLGGAVGDRVNLIAMVTADLHARGLRADTLLRAVAGRVGGTGGGRAELAQGGGRDPTALDAALAAVPAEVRRLLGGG